jgi:hypothetical protein
MAAEEPPTNVPRIADVQNPATGHYVVMVRMPTQLAAKYPDKPWGSRSAWRRGSPPTTRATCWWMSSR